MSSNNNNSDIYLPPPWINDAILCATAYLQQNLPGSFSLLVSPAAVTFVRPDGDVYQLGGNVLRRLTALNLAEVQRLDRPPASRPPPPRPDPPIPVPTAEEMTEIEAILDKSPQETMVNLSSDEENESPPPLPPQLDMTSPDYPDPSWPTVDELMDDCVLANDYEVPDLGLTATTTKDQIEELWNLYQREERRSVSNRTYRLHLAYLLGEIRHSHPATFRTFLHSGTRARRYFITTIDRAYELGQIISLSRLMGTRTLTVSHLRHLTRESFAEIKAFVRSPSSSSSSDSEDLVFNEGAL
jgi:hypothetical protein